MITFPSLPGARARAAGVVLVSLAAVAGLSACGGSSKPAASAPQPSSATDAPSTTPTTAKTVANPDPCVLVTKADAEKLAQTPLGDAVKSGTPDDLLCQYDGPPTGPTAQVEIFSGPGAKKSLDIDRGLSHVFTKVPGLGDEAYEESGNIFVRKGDVWTQINVVLLDVPENAVQTGLVALARTMASRI